MPVVLRSVSWQRVLAPAVVLALSVMVLAGTAGEGWWVGVPVLTAGAAVALAVRCWSLRVELRPTELVLVNWFRTTRLPWAEIDRCGHDDTGLWVRRTDGTEVRASAFEHGHRALPFARRPAEAAAARIEIIRSRQKAEPRNR